MFHTKFLCSKSCEICFEKSKKCFDNNNLIAHYDPDKPLVVSFNASGYGVGAYLSIVENNIKKPVQFLTATLSKAQRNYGNIQREALAIILLLTKFHKYIFGRQFTLTTDHQENH